ncbi:MAG: hypothetical protein JSV25_07420 [Spirochaetota bacterium]|nr:MAG: hypothetical protein JSV25_07420 [Spirochaetota bacterium]
MKRIIISISAALVVLSVLFYLLNKNIIKFENTKVTDVIGKSVESEYEQKVRLAAIAVKRRITIEDKKIDFLLKDVNLKQELSDADGLVKFNEYVVSQGQCERIRVINQNLELMFSTADNDLPRSKLEKTFYGKFYTENIPINIDPLARTIIFSKAVSSDSKDSYRVLFYYNWELLHSLFQRIETLDYVDFLFADEKLILINFPEITSGDEINIERIREMVSEKSSGAIRVVMKNADVTVYYNEIDEPYNEFTVGLTVATEELGLSKVGIVLLISQAVVVLTLLFFVFIIIRQKRGAGVGFGIKASESTDVTAEDAGESSETGNISFDRDILAPEAGIVSLSDVEEVAEVEEIGEAEVTEEMADLGGYEAGKAEGSPETKPKEPEKLEIDKDAGVIETTDAVVNREKKSEEKSGQQSSVATSDGKKSSAKNGKKASKSTSLNQVETIEDDLQSIEDSKSLPKLDKLVSETEDKLYVGDVENEKSTTKTMRQKVKVKDTRKEEGIVIPDEVYKQKEKQSKDDELSYLIDSMEQVDESTTMNEKEEDSDRSKKIPNTVERVFQKFFKNTELTKGALLIRDENNIFSVVLSKGFSKTSIKKLKFDGSERVYKSIIAKKKLLFIKEDAFVDKEIRGKFNSDDASKIKSLYFAPVGDEEIIKGMMIVCIMMDEGISSELITKEIKKIIKIIQEYI